MAADLLQQYGRYPIATTFHENDQMEEVRGPAYVEPAYDAAFDAEDGVKRHAACDECRKRKLKCSGEPMGCSRCLKQKLVCHYSEQKQMGRPRKKPRADEDESAGPDAQKNVSPEATRQRRAIHQIDPDDNMAFENICSAAYTQYLNTHTPAPRAPFVGIREDRNGSLHGSSEGTLSSAGPPTPPISVIPEGAYPSNLALWPDYSQMLQLPQIVQDNHTETAFSSDQSMTDQPTDISSLSDELGILPTIPSCPCLPNLYLTLSTLSTLSSFPVGPHTVITLQTAARTAHGVLYCRICPQKFQTGMQNVMLLGTLLTVLADAWHRVRRLTPEELRTNFSNNNPSSRSRSSPSIADPKTTAPETTSNPLTARERLEWLTFKHLLIRNNVFGDGDAPIPPTNTSSTGSQSRLHPPTPGTALLTLIDGMTRRQEHWHHPNMATGEFPPRLVHDGAEERHHLGMTLNEIEQVEKSAREGTQRHFCLTLVDRARAAIKSLDSPAPVWGE